MPLLSFRFLAALWLQWSGAHTELHLGFQRHQGRVAFCTEETICWYYLSFCETPYTRARTHTHIDMHVLTALLKQTCRWHEVRERGETGDRGVRMACI